jgi:hypothetical protein
MKRSRAAIGTALVTSTLTSLALLTGPGATAAVQSAPLAKGLIGPLQMDVEQIGSGPTRVVVAQSFAGLLSEVNDDGTLDTLFASPQTEAGPKLEVSGVAIEGDDVAFLTTKNVTKKSPKPASHLNVLSGGTVTKVADLQAFEEEVNPDGETRYGFSGLTQNCKKKLPPPMKSYKGIVESHPYGLADAPDGGWYVADAAGNSILHVMPDGSVEAVSVLPPQQVKVTKARAAAFDLPKCVIGKKFGFEAVPTDVEVAEDGSLIVSLLPGGPEDESLGARGKVVSIDPETGASTPLAKGFLGATNVAIGGDGTIYVSQLMGGKITAIDGDAVFTYHEANQPAALEWANGQLYASINAMNFKKGGKLVTLLPEMTRE